MTDTASDPTTDEAMPLVPARALLRVRKIWMTPAVLAGVLITLISLIYVGSVVNPTAHLSDLPVLIVDQDAGATIDGQSVNVGQQLTSALRGSTQVTRRLDLQTMTLSEADHRMDDGGAYATIVIPPNFTSSLLPIYGLGSTATNSPGAGLPTIQILTNQRAGTVGTSLATGVTQPAIANVMKIVSAKLSAQAAATPSSTPSSTPSAALTALTALQANPVTVTTQTYRPLPDHSALGLSAFYIALLTIMCGFLGATITNSSLDSATGFAPTEIGPRWRLRRPLLMTRWQTLLLKWSVAAVLVPVLTGLMLIVSIGALHMHAPNVLVLWLFTSFAAIVVALGTLVLFALFGSLGQLFAMLVFLYLSLASSGGTIPIEALPQPLRFAADIEPLRQILGGVRSIIYFNLSADSGLTRGLVMTAIGLVFWLLAGVGVTRFYDKRGLARISPQALSYVDHAIADLRTRQTGTGADQASPNAAGSERTSSVN